MVVQQPFLQVVATNELYQYFIIFGRTCPANNHVHIYLTRLLLSHHGLDQHLLPNNQDKLIFSDNTHVSRLSFEILYSTPCTITIELNKQPKYVLQRVGFSERNRNRYVGVGTIIFQNDETIDDRKIYLIVKLNICVCLY